MPKRALITGLTGQDGSYLAELLLSKGYEVYGLRRRSSSFNTGRVDHLITDFRHEADAKLFLVYGDLADASSLSRLLHNIRPDEIYNLGSQSHVHVSFEMPEYTADVTGLGAIRILEAVRESGIETRIYQASSSEMFGSNPPPQNEATQFHPRSPYGCAKVYAHFISMNYRESYGMHVSNGILFNHESPRRGENFVTRKITRAVARIQKGLQEKLFLGNLDARRDWGYAPEYVEAMWLMLQQPEPDDYVIATGKAYSVRDFVERAFAHVGLDWQQYVEIDPRYYRPAEVDHLVGDATRARDKLGWSPKVGIDELVTIMVDADIELLDERMRRGEEYTLSQAEAAAQLRRET